MSLALCLHISHEIFVRLQMFQVGGSDLGDNYAKFVYLYSFSLNPFRSSICDSCKVHVTLTRM
jgi:hypothetical protein